MRIDRLALAWIASDESADPPPWDGPASEIAQLRTALAHRDTIGMAKGLLMMRDYPPIAQSNPGSAVENIVEGFRFVLQNPPILALLVLLAIISLTAMPYMVLMPIFADQILHGGARGLGLLMGASGIGALVSAIVLAMQ